MNIGTIGALWRFPVKSFRGEQLNHAEFGQYGIVGDRAYALIDEETGKVVSAKSVKLFPDLLKCSAVFVRPPQSGQVLPPVQITLADGTTVISDAKETDRVLSEFFKRKVTLARTAPDDFTIDQYHPDLEHLDPAEHRDTFTESKLGNALFREIGVESPLPPGSFLDVFPLSVISTSALAQLDFARPETNFDVQRFRMNMVVKTDEPGFIENTWIGHTLTIGSKVEIMIKTPDPRCVMPTLAQTGIPRDTHVLRTLVEHNSLDFMGAGKFPCAGVYAVVEATGVVDVNDSVELG